MSQLQQTPLCVDLDGTLTPTNSILELGIRSLKKNPFRIFDLLAKSFISKAAVKERIGQYSAQEPLHLPYNKELLAWLTKEHQKRRPLILATASDMAVATKVAQELGIFQEVIASTRAKPINASSKYTVLQKRFGEKGFSYAGNSREDLSVWNIAASAIIVDAPKDVAAIVQKQMSVEAMFASKEPLSLGIILKEIRIHQWLKNLLLFIPAIAAHAALQGPIIFHAMIGFISFSFFASSVYVFNDIMDISSDRLHRTKHVRPIAAGKLSIGEAGILGISLATISVALALFTLPISFTLIIGLYAGINIIYSLWAKKIPYLDIGILAGLYVLRIIAGSAATGIETSTWLFLFAGCFFLNLAIVKRITEIVALKDNEEMAHGRGYGKRDKNVLTGIGMICASLACIVLAFYITSASVMRLYTTPSILWIIVPALIVWIARIWRLALHKKLPDDPVLFASKDATSYLLVAIMAASMLLAT